MTRRASTISPEQAEFNALTAQFKSCVERLKSLWLRKYNRIPRGAGLYELDPEERQRADRVIAAWEKYITPLAERWWKKCGYEIVWPEHASDPCGYRKLQAA
jgi:hypothetical protein